MRRSFLVVLVFLLNYHLVVAQPSTLQSIDCFSGTNSSVKLNISTVYGQVITDDRLGTHLNLTVFGNSSQNIVGAASSTLPLCEILLFYSRVSCAHSSPRDSHSFHYNHSIDTQCLYY